MKALIERSYLFILVGILLQTACSKDSSEPEVENTMTDFIEIEYVIDYGNDTKASDLRILYKVKTVNDFSELRLFIAPEGSFSKLNSTTLSELASNQFQKIGFSESLTEVRPSGTLLDTDGNEIRENMAYILGFATVQDGKISREYSLYKFELKDQHYLTGRYIGEWLDPSGSYIYSMELKEVGNQIRGPVYFSNNFVSHWGTGDEGTISFDIEGDQLSNVKYDEFLSGFMDGCVGLWTGNGKVEDLITLSFNLEGKNCDRSSTQVRLDFKRYSIQ